MTELSTDLLETGVSVFVAFCALMLALRAWRLSTATWYRQALFVARADLFDAAVEKDALDDPAYREMESAINGLLLWLDEIDGCSVARLLMNLRHRNLPGWDHSSGLLEREIETAKQRVRRALLAHLWTSTFSGCFLMSVLWMMRSVNRLVASVIAYSLKRSYDQEHGRRPNRWSDLTGRQYA